MLPKHTFAIVTTIALLIVCVSCSFNIYELQQRIKGYALSDDEITNQRKQLYEESIYIDNGSYQMRPKGLVIPLTRSDIQETVLFAQKFNASFSVKGGGHSARGYSLNPDIVLDMRYFNKTIVYEKEELVSIQAGIRWNDLYAQIAPWVPVGGTCPHVGVMGFTLGGGYSMFSRSYGLGSDNVQLFEVVLPNGEYALVTNDTNPDLFWALRGGGGGNYGVVISMTSNVYKDHDVFTAEVCWTFDQALVVIDFYNRWVQTVPNEMAVYGIFFQIPGTQEDSFCLTFAYNGPFQKGYDLFQPFTTFEGKVIFVTEQKIGSFMKSFGTGVTDIKHRLGLVKSGMVNKGGLTNDLIYTFYKYMSSRPSKSSMLIWSHVGGKIRDINVESSAFYRRNAEFVVEVKAIFDNESQHDVNQRWLDAFYSEMYPHFDGAYLNYIDADLPDWKNAYYGSHYSKLLQIKKKYDPNNLFSFAQSIGALTPKEKEFEMLRAVHQFQTGQINRDISLLDPLFADDSVANIPIGSSHVEGRKTIISNFATFFDTLINITETITSKIEINEQYAGFSKSITQFTKKGCKVDYTVLNWFIFDRELKIKEFSALFNLTHIIEQANCKPYIKP